MDSKEFLPRGSIRATRGRLRIDEKAGARYHQVRQTVWLLLVENIGNLREPATLPGWLATTTSRECIRVLRAGRRQDHVELPPEDEMRADPTFPTVEEDILAAERDAELRAAFAELPDECRELLSMLVRDPPWAYADVASALGIAVGSIGPKRGRCLTRLRRSPRLMAIIDSGAWDAGVERTRGDVGD